MPLKWTGYSIEESIEETDSLGGSASLTLGSSCQAPAGGAAPSGKGGAGGKGKAMGGKGKVKSQFELQCEKEGKDPVEELKVSLSLVSHPKLAPNPLNVHDVSFPVVLFAGY